MIDVVNIRVYRQDRDRLAEVMQYGESMADRINDMTNREIKRVKRSERK